MKFLLTLIISVGLLTEIHSQTLTAGDIAFITINTDSNDGWAWVALVNIPSGEVVHFTDNGYDADASPALLTNEGTITFTISTEIPAGTVFNITKSSSNFTPNTYGSISGSISSMNIGGDNLFAYQGSASSPTFIAGVYINYNSLKYSATTKWNAPGNPVSANDSELPPGLTDGDNAVSLYPGITEKDNARYTGILVGTRAELLSAINNFSNWTDAGDSNENYTFTGGPFTVYASVATAPEINVKQSTTGIATGGSHAFGTVQIGASSDVVFTVENTGDADLDISSITPTGGGFSIQSGISTDPISASSTATFTVRFQPSTTSQTSGSVTITSDDADEGSYVINFTATVIDATLSIKVFLEGPLSGSSMSTTLNGSLPTDPTTVYGGIVSETSSAIPATAVDWVEVELRSGTGAATKVGANRAGILTSDGTIVDKEGNSFTMSQVDGSSYYIVIHHRNHLSVMSASAIAPSGGAYTVDFTAAQANNYNNGSNGAIQVGSVFAMYSGDADDNGTVNGTDLSAWRAQNGEPYSYSSNGKTDLNLDGVINAVDRNDHQKNNSGKSTQVPSS